jgi:NAD(P)-dependent dehydrogenase (short-subunit alcohol dehydrogenase family)
MTATAVVTGANQGLGLAIVERLARTLGPDAHVYLTGRDEDRVRAAARELSDEGLRVVPHRVDVREADEVDAFADLIARRHGQVDVVVSNAAARLTPDRTDAEQVDTFVDTNNLGTGRMIRAFGPLLGPDGRFLVVASAFGSLRNLPAHLHHRFDTGTMSLDDLDTVLLGWAEEVRTGTARTTGWPEWINIPSKIGQVAAARIFAREVGAREVGGREVGGHAGRLVTAVCPGLVDTDASRPWFPDMSQAQSAREAAVDVVALAVEPVRPHTYGALVQHGQVIPWE